MHIELKDVQLFKLKIYSYEPLLDLILKNAWKKKNAVDSLILIVFYVIGLLHD